MRRLAMASAAAAWRILHSIGILAAMSLPGALSAETVRLVTPDALPEAQALFDTLQQISGHYTLTGQHNYPASGDRNSRFAAKYTGEMPAVWTTDFGFAGEHDKDSAHVRADIVKEAIRQHQAGSIVSICWHAVPPTADEPVTFMPKPGADPAKLESVQGRLLDAQFKDVLTPGTALHAKWEEQVDRIAGFLKQLEEAKVPVLWRPYHEMNGDWFWWGGRYEGEYTTAALYRQIFDRLVNYHHLKNLVWVWSVDRVHRPAMDHDKYFPGIGFVDMLALDVYGRDFAQSYYDSLVSLSHGKPLALAEVGNPPTPAVLEKQPLWTYFAVWAGMVRNTLRSEYEALYADPRILTRNSAKYRDVMASYRKTCGLPPIDVSQPPANFTGNWVINEELSNFGPSGAAAAPARLHVEQGDGMLSVKTTVIREFTDDETTEQSIPLDGSAVESTAGNFPRTTKASVGEDGQTILLSSTSRVAFGGSPGRVLKSNETWTLSEAGTRLTIRRISDSFRGNGKVEQKLVFDRR